ncbi:TPA: protein kinase [Legionella pneumophila subsp. pneumophila]|nr:protein kinase family protein [Legionella pneumophila]HAT8938907.1 protein kinase [Legionella pneumophila subsp. pneumophila]PYB51677.1 protein kinase family protein [Legionella pneumophila]PYB63881.1 protein kinase family protein [Legionella pneumophila]RYW83384.1 protein kinase family protein [Legionella pneumophila]
MGIIMATVDSELGAMLEEERIKALSKKAIEHFTESDTRNIFEDGLDQLKIVRLFDKERNPIYFLVSQKLGAGAFGEVSRGIQLDIESGTVIPDTDVAIKITDFSEGGTLGKADIQSAQKDTEHEYDILSRIQQSKGFSLGQRVKHVKLEVDEGVFIEREANVQEAVVAMPLHPGKDIQHRAHKDKFSYGSITFAELASTLCSNLETLHNNNIIHSDLKPANIIWDPQTNQANIVDFNRAKLISSDETHVYSSSSSDKAYMAADCFTENRGYRFSKASDVYSLGKILTEKFDINITDGQKESLSNKKYLSYDQLMIKSFLEKMTATDEAKRPTIKECKEFFNQIENKMKLDLEQPENKARLELSKKIISLEVYANQLRNEIQNQNKLDKFLSSAGLTADKTKKYEETIKTIELLTRALSSPKIDMELIKSHQQQLQQADANANGIFSFKGRFHKIIEEVRQTTAESKGNEEVSQFRPK